MDGRPRTVIAAAGARPKSVPRWQSGGSPQAGSQHPLKRSAQRLSASPGQALTSRPMAARQSGPAFMTRRIRALGPRSSGP